MDVRMNDRLPAGNNTVKENAMATPSLRLPENVPGPFYITNECIDCDMCRETAPTVFRRDDDISYSVVFHQPETEAEHEQAMEGLKGCPVEAIGFAES